MAICNGVRGMARRFCRPVGGGGGISQYNPIPAWQGGVYGIGNAATSTTYRNEPDLSFFASAGWWGHFLPYCQSDTGWRAITPMTPMPYYMGAGGTSFVAPSAG